MTTLWSGDDLGDIFDGQGNTGVIDYDSSDV